MSPVNSRFTRPRTSKKSTPVARATMVRLFGRGNNHRQQRQRSDDKLVTGGGTAGGTKKRLSPSVDWIAGETTSEGNQSSLPASARRTRIGIDSPMYRYAMDEYAQAVAPGTSNDDGRMLPTDYSQQQQQLYSDETNATVHAAATATGTPGTRPSALDATMTPGMMHSSVVSPYAPSALFGARVASREEDTNDHANQDGEQQSSHRQDIGLHEYPTLGSGATAAAMDANTSNVPQMYETSGGSMPYPNIDKTSGNSRLRHWSSSLDMPDATYEEIYGEAYVGGTIKYVYPSGYQSMRPRSCPWKLSIVVCLLFTWLSVFIVGHCSDQANEISNYANYANSNEAGDAAGSENYASSGATTTSTSDDDDIRWCGSRPLYLLWVASMLVTGLSAAYCSVIGYIKVRDFAVANARSQPPGVAQGTSDYYVRIHDDVNTNVPLSSIPTGNGLPLPAMMMVRGASSSDGGASSFVYRPTIYQSDGTPQFWGAHIYRPTQAAVAVTSR